MNWTLILFSLTALSPVSAMIEVLRNGRILPSRTAEFGPRIQMDGITGILLPVELLDEKGSKKGCQVLKTPPVLKVNSVDVPWIALVERGECTFLQKVKAMQESGAFAVVVGGTSDTNPRTGGLIRMSAGKGEEESAKSVTIPSAYVMKWEYEELQKQLHSDPEEKAKFKTIALMKDGRGVPHLAVKLMPDAFDDMPLLNMTVVMLILPMLMILGLWAIWQCRNGDGFDEEYESIYLIPQRYRSRPEDMPASLAAVNNLPRTHYDPHTRGPNEADLCAICLDDFVLGDELRKLPCKHEFHVSCIDPWLLTRKRFCPVCKGDSCPNCLHSRAFSTPETTSSHANIADPTVDLAIPENVSTSSIILDPSPSIEGDVEEVGEGDSLLTGGGQTTSLADSPDAHLQPRRSLLSSVFERAWKSSTSVLLSPRSGARSSRISVQPPFPVVDPDDYESARQLALNNRTRNPSNNSGR